jgi:hypothetical protein
MVDIWNATRYIAVAGPSDFTNEEWKARNPDYVLRPGVHQDYALLKVLYRLRRTTLEPPVLRVNHFQCDETIVPLDFSHLQDSDAIFIAGHGDSKGLYAMGPNADRGMDRLVTILTGDGNLKRLRAGKKIVILLMSCRAGLGLHKALARKLSKKLSIDVTVGGAQGFTFGSNRTGMLGLNEVLIPGIPWIMEYPGSMTREEAEAQTSAREGRPITYEGKRTEIEQFLKDKTELEDAFKDVVARLRAIEVNNALDEIDTRFRERWSGVMQAQFELYAMAKTRSKLDFDMWFDLITEGYLWTDGHSVSDAQVARLLAGDMVPQNKELASTR